MGLPGTIIPAGTIITYAGQEGNLNTLFSAGWLQCDGSAVTTTEYPSLYLAIGTTYGTTGSGYFNLPDLRGVFLRGIDTTGVEDPDYESRTSPVANDMTVVGPIVGSRQADQVRNHQHNFDLNFGSISWDGNNLDVQLADDPNQYSNRGTKPTTNVDGGGNETRPYNVYVYYLIYTG